MFQSWPIRTKMIAVVVLPLIALAGFGVVQVKNSVNSLGNARRIDRQIGMFAPLTTAMATLEDERYSTRTYIDSRRLQGGPTVVADRKATDKAVVALQVALRGLHLTSADEAITRAIATMQPLLNQLPAQRALVGTKRPGDPTAVDFFTNTIGAVNGVLGRMAQRGNPDILASAEVLLLVATMESASVEPVILNPVIVNQGGRFTPRQFQQYITASSNANNNNLSLFSFASKPHLAILSRLGTDPKVALARRVNDQVTAAGSAAAPLPASVRDYGPVVNDLVSRVRAIEATFGSDTKALATHRAADARRSAIVTAAVVLLVIVLSVGLSFVISRSIQRRLRRLQSESLQIAEVQLPSVVSRLQEGEGVDLDSEAKPLSIGADDEIGEVAVAFNSVLDTAMRVTVEQAAMRKSTGDMFLNLARRNQALVHRQLKVIDRLERKESDPDDLEELFRLDHLATRMRRHAEDLIVLSGAVPARGWRKAVGLSDVARGAVAEVEDYTRVTVLPIADSAVSGHAVGDIIHLLAELIENATSFSPPHTPVHVLGHEVANGCVVEVEDRGLGISVEDRDKLNARLANPPRFDLSTSERLGLYVVAQLAQRHGVKVQLRPSPYGGTTAIVLLPQSLIEPDPEARSAPERGGRGPGHRRDDGETSPGAPAPALPASDLAASDLAASDLAASDLAASDLAAWTPVADGDDVDTSLDDSPPRRRSRRHDGPPVPGVSPAAGVAPADDWPSTAWPAVAERPSRTESAGETETADAYEAFAEETLVEPALDAVVRPDLDDLLEPVDVDHGGHRANPPATQASWFVRGRDPLSSADWSPGGRAPLADPPRRATDDAVGRRAASRHTSWTRDDVADETPGAADAPDAGRAAGPEDVLTAGGLPKRTRRASLAPGLRGGDTAAHSPSAPGAPRSAADARTVMNSFQAGFGRGLRDALATEQETTENAEGPR